MSKTLIAAATAATIGLGALGATTGTAAASDFRGGGYISGPNFTIGFGNYDRDRHFRRHCRPVFKTQRVFVPRHGWTLAKVKVGERCGRPRHHRRYWW